MNCLLLLLGFTALLLHKERRRVRENHIASYIWKVMHLQLWKFLKFYFLDYYFLKMNESLTEPAKLLLLVSCYPSCSHYIANSLHSADSSDRLASEGGIACKGSHHFEQCEVLPERYITKIGFHLHSSTSWQPRRRSILPMTDKFWWTVLHAFLSLY